MHLDIKIYENIKKKTEEKTQLVKTTKMYLGTNKAFGLVGTFFALMRQLPTKSSFLHLL